MDAQHTFIDLIHRVRSGDPAAAADLVRRYEPAVRRAARLQLRDPRLRRILDSVDVCQSVLASFFVRVASGQYELDRPEQLLRLLAVMARNKLASQARRAYVLRRKARPEEIGESEPLSPLPDPSQLAAWRDLLQVVRGRLTVDERQLADRRALRQEWTQIAAEVGGSPEALRKKLARALDRVSRQIDLDDLPQD
jgi:RNA polymerase sigma-70 factor (ECF subfamily)